MKETSLLLLLFAMLFLPLHAQKQDSIKKDSTHFPTEEKRYNSYQHSFYNHFSTNPAFTGMEECYTASLSMDKPMVPATELNRAVSFITSGDFTLSRKFPLAVGIYYKYDVAGPFTTSSLSMSLAYPFSYRNHHIRVGIGAKYCHEHFAYNQLTFGDQISNLYGFIYDDSEMRPLEDKFNLADINIGLWYQWKGLFAGFAVNNLISKTYIYEGPYLKLNRTYSIEAGYNYIPIKKLTLTPALIFVQIANRKSTWIPSVSLSYNNWLYFSVACQNFNTMKAYLGFCIMKRIILFGSAGVSTNSALYDVSPLESFTAGLKFTLK